MIKEIATNKLLPIAIAFPSIKHIPILGYYAIEIHAENVRKVRIIQSKEKYQSIILRTMSI